MEILEDLVYHCVPHRPRCERAQFIEGLHQERGFDGFEQDPDYVVMMLAQGAVFGIAGDQRGGEARTIDPEAFL